MESKIKIIYKNKDLLEKIFITDRVHFSSDETYIGIERQHRNNSENENIRQSIIFVSGGIWQYNFINTTPSDKKYIGVEQYIDALVDEIEMFKDNGNKVDVKKLDIIEIPDNAQYVMVQREGCEDITFSVSKIERDRNYINVSKWACRDNYNGDSLGSQYCGGGGDSYRDTVFDEYDKVTDLKAPHFLRMVQYLHEFKLPIRYWDGEKIVDIDVKLAKWKYLLDKEKSYPMPEVKEEVKEEVVAKKPEVKEEIKEEVKVEKDENDGWTKPRVYKVDAKNRDEKIIYKRRLVYFTDYSYAEFKQDEEVRDILRDFSLHGDIAFDQDVLVTHNPPSGLTFGICCFDYGGVMGKGADDSVWSHCKWIVDDAIKNPKRDYILTSTFSSFVGYMKEAIDEVKYLNDGIVPANIYFSIKDFLLKNNYKARV